MATDLTPQQKRNVNIGVFLVFLAAFALSCLQDILFPIHNWQDYLWRSILDTGLVILLLPIAAFVFIFAIIKGVDRQSSESNFRPERVLIGKLMMVFFLVLAIVLSISLFRNFIRKELADLRSTPISVIDIFLEGHDYSKGRATVLFSNSGEFNYNVDLPYNWRSLIPGHSYRITWTPNTRMLVKIEKVH